MVRIICITTAPQLGHNKQRFVPSKARCSDHFIYMNLGLSPVLSPASVMAVREDLLRLSSSRASRHTGQQLDAREDDPLQCVQPLPMRCWLSSGLPGMFRAMSSLVVLFFYHNVIRIPGQNCSYAPKSPTLYGGMYPEALFTRECVTLTGLA